MNLLRLMTMSAAVCLCGASVAQVNAEQLQFQISTSYAESGGWTMHGFFLSLSSNYLTHTPTRSTLPDQAVLQSISLKGGAGTGTDGMGVTYGLLLLGESDNTVLGMSQGTQMTVASGSTSNTMTFSMVGVDGSSPVMMNTADTYRFITVKQEVLTAITSSGASTVVYNGGSINTLTQTESDGTLTLTNGLAAPRIRMHQMNGTPNNQLSVISGRDMTSKFNEDSKAYLPYITDIIVLPVPEPATAALTLLGLGGLCLRRKK